MLLSVFAALLLDAVAVDSDDYADTFKTNSLTIMAVEASSISLLLRFIFLHVSKEHNCGMNGAWWECESAEA